MEADHELLIYIFSDATVVDIDMAEWDERISLYVLADHYRDWSEQEGALCPLVRVTFLGISELLIRFRHLRFPPLEEGQRYHWTIDDPEIEDGHDGWRMSLCSTSEPMPELALVCKAVDVQEMDHDAFERVFPGWSKLYGGFARPSIEASLKRESSK